MAFISIDRRNLKQIDWWIVGALAALTVFGILLIYGTTYEIPYKRHLAKRQMMWWGISLAVFFFILLIDYSQLVKPSIAAYVGCIGLLVGLLVLDFVTPKRAASWYDLRFGRLQPSEFTKIAVVLVVAAYFSRLKHRLPDWLDLIVVALLVMLPFALIALQPDLGTAVVFLPLLVIMPWAAGAGVSRRVGLIFAGILLAVGLAYGRAVVVRGGDFPFLKPYQERRLKAFVAGIVPDKWLNTDQLGLDRTILDRTDWAPRQALIAIGSGRFWGKGWLNGTQTGWEFLPEAHTDYIFSSCGEQFGFAGCALVLLLYISLVYRSLLAALRSKDWFGYLIIVGVLTVFSAHIFLNVAVATDLLPVTGLPLPFLSYGGSFLLTMYIGFALVVNVGMRRYWF